MNYSPRSGGLGARYDPVIIEDDDDDADIASRFPRIREEARTGRELAEWAALRNDARNASRDQEERIENILEEGIREIVDLTGDEDRAPSPPRLPTPRQEGRELQSYTSRRCGLEIVVGETIELNHDLGAHGVQFLRIESIFQPNCGSEVVIRGFGFARTRQLDGMLPRRLNEVALVAEIRTSDQSRWRDHALVAVTETSILCCRELRITNSPFPEHRFSTSEYEKEGKGWIEDHGPLVCRCRFDMYYHAEKEKPYEWAVVQISEEEADSAYRTPDSQNLIRWRGGKVPGGSYSSSSGFSQPVVDLEGPSNPVSSLSPGQRYTAGDVFAGAGGASRGIERAGLKLVFAVDHWDHATQSLRSNFPSTRVYNMNVTDFITAKDTKCDVDILHLSPPCQFWSPAHTVAGKNDENNIAVLFSCTDLIKKFRPRLFTVEQTFGILSPKFSEFFNTLLHGFTKFGYSVTWKVTPLANYGVPQLRKRLLMIGSAPGEPLPPFPPATHNKHGTHGLKPWTTPLSLLTPLDHPRFTEHHPLHRPHLSRPFNPPKPAWDPAKLARTITTNGGQNYHWTGTRDFTLLEYAVLQGFPTWHRFEGRSVKKQIGNAFAPSVVRVLYQHLVRWLLRQDGFGAGGGGSGGGVAAGVEAGVEYIRVEDDDGGDEEEEVAYLGSRETLQRLSEAVRMLNEAAKEEAEGDFVMDLGEVDDLSDTETLRGDEDAEDHMEVEWVGYRALGTADAPYVL